MDKFPRNVILGENNELRYRDMLVGASLTELSIQSATEESPKSSICTLKEMAEIRCIETNPMMTQKERALTTQKSERTVKAITSALVERGILIRRNGRRNGWLGIITPI